MSEQQEQYEGIFILDSEQAEESLTQLQEKITGQITQGGGKIEATQVWGKRRLAYRVRNKRDGFYVLLRFQAAPASIEPLGQWCALQEGLLRQLVTKAEQPLETAEVGQDGKSK